MKINKKSYKLTEDNYFKEVYPKKQIVIGHNSRSDMSHWAGWKYRCGGNYKKTSPFSIDRDGSVYQHFDPKYYSSFLDIEQDKLNIPILLVNVGWLKRINMEDIYIDWLGNEYKDKNNIINKRWRNYDYWYKYTDEQISSLKELTTYLCNEFNIKNNLNEYNVYDENIDLVDGITFRSNYLQEATDVSPALDISLLKNI